MLILRSNLTCISTHMRIKPSSLLYVVASFIFLFSAFHGHAQQSLLEKLSAYKNFSQDHPFEKIHVHTNQPHYLNHDTLWLKAYILHSNLNRPSAISHTLNVELIDPEGKRIREAKLKVTMGLADGYLNLSDTLKTGNYLLNVYTNHMEKLGEEFYYRKSIYIHDGSIQKEVNVPAGLAVTFFPEGGELVQNIPSVVGFKAIDQRGLGMGIKGVIKDDQGQVITRLSSEHLGMGKFHLHPQTGRKYLAEVQDEKGNTAQFSLPEAQHSGYVLRAQSTPDSIILHIIYGPELSGQPFTIVAMQDGITRYISQPKTTPFGSRLFIHKSQFYTGIVQWTLFDALGHPRAERLTFCDHQDFLKIQANLKGNYAKRDPVKASIELKNVDQEGEIASLSIAVFSETAYPYDDDQETSIYTDLLLTSDLKGYIEKPNAYFTGKDTLKSRQNLDLLLLTQGWRKFSWKEKLFKALPAVHDIPQTDKQVSGRVLLSSGKPYVGGTISLFQSGQKQEIFQTSSDQEGRFTFDDLTIVDTVSFVISTNTDQSKKNHRIEVFNLGKPARQITSANQFPFPILKPDSSPSENLALDQLDIQLKGINLNEVKIVGKKSNGVIESSNLNGPGKADAVILAKDLLTTHDLTTYLTNHITGLKIWDGKIYSREIPDRNKGAEFDLPNPNNSFLPGPKPMLVVMDGTYLDQETFNISNLDPNDVASIEVLKGTSAALYGIEGAYGVLIISLKRGKAPSPEDYLKRASFGVLPFRLLGYQSLREFYHPQYPVQQEKDVRKVLYWNPAAMTSPEGKTTIEFLNSDYIGKFSIVIQAMNADGQIGRAVYQYEVK